MFLPYVYIVRNRNTGEFYIGMRSANKVVAEQDLGIKYFTSSKRVKKNFTEFDIEIIAYFIDQLAAFEFENELIKEHWGDRLLLNRHYQKSMTKFSMTGSKRQDLAEYNKTKAKPKETRIYCCSECNNVFERIEFTHHPVKIDPVCGQVCNGKRNGKSGFRHTGPNIKLRGRGCWNKGVAGTGFGNLTTNPMKNPELVAKMIASRKRNKELRAEALNKGSI
jgi:hypothetical protein